MKRKKKNQFLRRYRSSTRFLVEFKTFWLTQHSFLFHSSPIFFFSFFFLLQWKIHRDKTFYSTGCGAHVERRAPRRAEVPINLPVIPIDRSAVAAKKACVFMQRRGNIEFFPRQWKAVTLATTPPPPPPSRACKKEASVHRVTQDSQQLAHNTGRDYNRLCPTRALTREQSLPPLARWNFSRSRRKAFITRRDLGKKFRDQLYRASICNLCAQFSHERLVIFEPHLWDTFLLLF